MKRPINLTPRTVKWIHVVALSVTVSTLFVCVVLLVAWSLGYYPDYPMTPPFFWTAMAGLGVSGLVDFLTRKEVEP